MATKMIPASTLQISCSRVILTLLLTLLIAPVAQADQGIYYGGSDTAALDWARSAGLSFVIAPPSHKLEQQLAARGMTAIWNVSFHNPNSALVAEYGMSSVTRGWYVADEPQPSDGGMLRSWNQTVHSLDAHPTYSVHWGCNKAQARGSMLPFKDGADWMGTDCYPIGVSSSRLVGPAFTEGARVASRLQKNFWTVLQAASWDSMCGTACGRTESQWPSIREMQIMRDCAAKTTNTIVWYSLDDVLKGGQRRLNDLAAAIRSPRKPCPSLPHVN